MDSISLLRKCQIMDSVWSNCDVAEALKMEAKLFPTSKEQAARFDSMNNNGGYILYRGCNRYLDTIVDHVHYICITEE